ncbi:hypothetical protein [Marinobacter subterrani]|uniref:hypothetical protein n=1 Tax=Marinobacter subterrani TaxID=1658765 RepID=UPI00235734F9|nr:hypothetical protein [Marinobacter subterrani]
MGIKACDRNGCDRIMCDNYSDQFGYLCFECMTELQSKAGNITIGDFMASPKGADKPAEPATLDDIDAAFNPS